MLVTCGVGLPDTVRPPGSLHACGHWHVLTHRAAAHRARTHVSGGRRRYRAQANGMNRQPWFATGHVGQVLDEQRHLRDALDYKKSKLNDFVAVGLYSHQYYMRRGKLECPGKCLSQCNKGRIKKYNHIPGHLEMTLYARPINMPQPLLVLSRRKRIKLGIRHLCPSWTKTHPSAWSALQPGWLAQPRASFSHVPRAPRVSPAAGSKLQCQLRANMQQAKKKQKGRNERKKRDNLADARPRPALRARLAGSHDRRWYR